MFTHILPFFFRFSADKSQRKAQYTCRGSASRNVKSFVSKRVRHLLLGLFQIVSAGHEIDFIPGEGILGNGMVIV